MRRLLGSVLPALALAAVLAGCGDDDSGSVADDPAPTASPSPTVDFEVVEMITETAAGGQLDAGAPAAPLSDNAAVQQFIGQFGSDQITTRIQEAVDQAPVGEDELLYGAVVAIGCDAPGQVFVSAADEGVVITAGAIPSPHLECYAPMTTVALVLVPASAVS
jgi:hypothetical protein